MPYCQCMINLDAWDQLWGPPAGLRQNKHMQETEKNAGIQHWFHYVENLFCKIGIARMSLWSLFGFWEEVMSLRFFSSCFNDSSQSKSAASLKIQMRWCLAHPWVESWSFIRHKDFVFSFIIRISELKIKTNNNNKKNQPNVWLLTKVWKYTKF